MRPLLLCRPTRARRRWRLRQPSSLASRYGCRVAIRLSLCHVFQYDLLPWLHGRDISALPDHWPCRAACPAATAAWLQNHCCVLYLPCRCGGPAPPAADVRQLQVAGGRKTHRDLTKGREQKEKTQMSKIQALLEKDGGDYGAAFGSARGGGDGGDAPVFTKRRRI